MADSVLVTDHWHFMPSCSLYSGRGERKQLQSVLTVMKKTDMIPCKGMTRNKDRVITEVFFKMVFEQRPI